MTGFFQAAERVLQASVPQKYTPMQDYRLHLGIKFQATPLETFSVTVNQTSLLELAAVLNDPETRVRCHFHLFFRVESDFKVKLKKHLI